MAHARVSAARFSVLCVHTFRHFVASAEIEAGVDSMTVAVMLGHSTPITTLIYR
ncbi:MULTISPECIES: tyrosine-type recombinase/integrase [unclassified Ruminococcus]|uniref:tyrosine-type recombinase/integrase n=1 Tax=unclassified Ruminococcus TaxID=2608920 RepID=UPI001FA7FA16|nr:MULTISPECIES: tyrosine-type recombinase/integrase [unclassified Ruminococcus]